LLLAASAQLTDEAIALLAPGIGTRRLWISPAAPKDYRLWAICEMGECSGINSVDIYPITGRLLGDFRWKIADAP
jgi:hypothetical protein